VYALAGTYGKVDGFGLLRRELLLALGKFWRRRWCVGRWCVGGIGG
jgi:hypothetical protein